VSISPLPTALVQQGDVLKDDIAARTWKRYPEYRESGVEWLESIPSHWRIQKLKYAARVQFSNVDKKSEDDEQPVRLCNYVDVYYHDRITSDIEFMEATALPREIAKFQLWPGDVLVTKDSEDPNDICVPAVVAEELPHVLCGYHLAQLRPVPDDSSGPYMSYALASTGVRDQFRMRANGITRFGLSQDDICSSLIPMPPLPEQQSIAAFLDRKTRQIDALIAKKQRLITLLEEKRTALISHAVTKGLNPSAPMKPSDIEWLGDVPRHWEAKRIKHLLHEMIDTEHKTVEFYPDGGYLVVRTTNVRNGRLIMDGAKFTDDDGFREWTRRGQPQKGDILFTREAPAGEACLVPTNRPVCIGQRMVLFRVRRDVLDDRFGVYSIYSGVADEFIKSASQGSTVAHFNMADIGSIPMLVPPLPEQRRISDYLDALSANFDALMSTAETAITRLTEYRHALISAAVTGKIDVRKEVEA